MDVSQFEPMILPHLDAAYNLARWLLRNDHDAEDSVQEACLRAYRSFAGFRGTDGKAWLLTIVRNVCYSFLKKNRSAEFAAPFDEELHGAIEEAPDREHLALMQTHREWLGRALERLPIEFREVIVLHELEGMAYRDISVAVEIPIGTVMSRLARARRKLQLEIIEISRKEASHGM